MTMRQPLVTERLYYNDATLSCFNAEVTDIREASRANGQSVWQIALNRTAFYPTSGGQPFDVGTLEATSRSGAVLSVEVLEVVEDDAGEVWHVTQKPLLAGTMVTGRVNRERRVDHMQQHSGQHLLSAAFQRECAATTVSFRLGAESSTIDLAVEKLTDEVILRVEKLCNTVIAENRPVRLHTVQRAEAEALLAEGKLRKLPEREGTIRMVEITEFDLNACGGTHVRATGQIGGLLMRKVEKVRQGMRVEFVCGQRAVAAARLDYARLHAAAGLLTTAPAQLVEMIAKQVADGKAAAKERHTLLEEVARMTAASMVRESSADEGLMVRVFPDRDAEFLKLLAHALMKSVGGKIVLLASTQAEPAAVVLARTSGAEMHCGEVLRPQLAKFNARGGGSAEMAQGAVPRAALDALLAGLEADVRARVQR